MKVQLVAIVCCLVALQVSWGHSSDNILFCWTQVKSSTFDFNGNGIYPEISIVQNISIKYYLVKKMMMFILFGKTLCIIFQGQMSKINNVAIY